MNAQPTPPPGTPVAELEITPGLVRALLAAQHPGLAHLDLQPIGEGWDNAMFRLGESLAVRLPRRAAVAHLLRHEQAWLGRLAGQLPLPVPVPYRVGIPAAGYPWHWSVVPWIAGDPADVMVPAESQAPVLGAFLRSLHVPAPCDAPLNPVRGVPLSGRAKAMEERFRRIEPTMKPIIGRLRELWEVGLAAPLDVTPTWIHGDLHARNILVQDGTISGIIDWGDLAAGDPATDLASVWMLFDRPEARQEALRAYGGSSAATVERATAWAVLFGVMLLDTGLVDNPRNASLGQRVLQRVVG